MRNFDHTIILSFTDSFYAHFAGTTFCRAVISANMRAIVAFSVAKQRKVALENLKQLFLRSFLHAIFVLFWKFTPKQFKLFLKIRERK